MQLLYSVDDATTVQPPVAVSMWLFDPPYNIGFRYGSMVNDRKSDAEYADFVKKCADSMYRNGEDDCTLYYVNYPEIAGRTLQFFEEAGWTLKQWLSWVYPSNMGMSKNRFTRAHRAVLVFTKGTPTFNVKAVQQPYKNPNDKRIKKRIAEGSTGTNLYDWWNINLRKNVSKGYASWHNQLPFELVRRMILFSTNEGDWVGDLTAGGGTLWEVAKTLNRSAYLNDIDEDFVKNLEVIQ